MGGRRALRTRLRLLAGRVVAVDAMLDGAEFVEVYRCLADGHGFSRKAAFDIATRVFRSAAWRRTPSISKASSEVIDLVAVGRVARPVLDRQDRPHHVDAIEELLQRSLVQPAAVQT